mgnify:CR=1 FL=1
MVRQTGAKYPNGESKSRLLEVYLSYRDFACSPAEFQFDLNAIRTSEANGTCECEWIEHADGRTFVSGLSLADETKALEILSTGFRLVPVSHRVFISYAREDASAAREICQRLRDAGASPWLDEEMLLPGQR